MPTVPAFSPIGLLTEWSLGPFAIVVVIAAGALFAWYVDAAIRVRAKGRSWPGHRIVTFGLGLLSIVYALAGPISVWVMRYFPAHIVQHLVLMIVAPSLLAMAAPVTLALQTARGTARRLVTGFIHSRFLHVITFPLVVVIAYYIVMWWFFTTSAIGFAMTHMWVMDLLNLLFFAGGVLFWWPLVGKDPIVHWRMGWGAKLVSLAFGIPFETFLGLTIAGSRTSLAPMYSLTDWTTGGDVLWGLSEMLTTLAIGVIIWNWVASEERQTRRMSRSREAVPLSSRQDGLPKEYYWARQVIERMPAGSPMYEEARSVLERIDRERPPETAR
ncbi:integral membrane protein [Acidimicrobium ferrooxidans DSM 10331]|uniref:Integral membrane protein n=1 Tax=Acidimicrobium ferrooxidans (strain DSM 10331 / JCM 15462 / NBRC 103882 / ICP) TaxID=525909 RepID=C7LZA6_ACIFD|nr:cytochrome c oxidase assembly protein [Acidimicrobium ferrooxidans]ACU54064.1 integral membrane protein [Acidimicrobium ferrooxidans DSM 10331]